MISFIYIFMTDIVNNTTKLITIKFFVSYPSPIIYLVTVCGTNNYIIVLKYWNGTTCIHYRLYRRIIW